jgi:hypothetical protein
MFLDDYLQRPNYRLKHQQRRLKNIDGAFLTAVVVTICPNKVSLNFINKVMKTTSFNSKFHVVTVAQSISLKKFDSHFIQCPFRGITTTRLETPPSLDFLSAMCRTRLSPTPISRSDTDL